MSVPQQSIPMWVKTFLVPAIQLSVALVISSLVVLLVGESPTEPLA